MHFVSQISQGNCHGLHGRKIFGHFLHECHRITKRALRKMYVHIRRCVP